MTGLWTCEDDGSGLIAFFGWSLEFRYNGTGTSRYWSTEETSEFEFSWERISAKMVRLKSANGTSETITYRMVKHNGAYGAVYMKLSEWDQEAFWNSPAPLYRQIP